MYDMCINVHALYKTKGVGKRIFYLHVYEKQFSTEFKKKSAAMGKSGKPWSCFGVCIRKTSL